LTGFDWMEKEKKQNIAFSTPAVLPDGEGGFTPCPELLTEAEAIRYLRLDTLGVRDPRKTLQYYRERGLIKPARISNVNRYRRIELDRFMETLTNLTYERKHNENQDDKRQKE